jgi:uncharacterized protein (DUF1778 family)
MEERSQQVLSCKVSAEEADTIKSRAQARGISVSEFLRTRALAEADDNVIERLQALIKHAIYQINQTHIALYSIAEAEGEAKRFLSTQELRTVYDRVRAEAISYAVEFPEKLAAVQAEIAAAREKEQK